ncbi:SH3 domain-containing protein [Candidatus Latescibacterota bacterium]
MKSPLKYSILFLILIGTGCAGGFLVPGPESPLVVPAEGPVPGVPPELTTSDYWIRMTEHPDDLLMTPDDIDSLNTGIRARTDTVRDILSLPEQFDGTPFRDFIAASARYFDGEQLSMPGGVPLEEAERVRIIARVDTLAVPAAITPRFGITLHQTAGRIWPTDILMQLPSDVEIDQNMTAAVDMATPVALIHTSRDGRWVFVQTPRSLCWLPSEAVAFGTRETVRLFTEPSPPLVAVGDEVTVYASPESSVALGSLRMGDSLPLQTAGTEFCQVAVPVRGANGNVAVGSGFVRLSSDVSIGFLPYTLRNVYRQAFTLFGARWGYNGMYGGRDGAGFIVDIFRCFNIQLPRDITGQVQASPATLHFFGMDRDIRLVTIRSLPGGISLIGFDGHVMLYLGEAYGEQFVIHSLRNWRELDGTGTDIIHRTARVVVTGLNLEGGTGMGTYLDRLTDAAILGNYTVSQ